MDKKEILSLFAEKGCLLSPDLFQTLQNEKKEKILELLTLVERLDNNPGVLTSKIFFTLKAGQDNSKGEIVQSEQSELQAPRVEVEVIIEHKEAIGKSKISKQIFEIKDEIKELEKSDKVKELETEAKIQSELGNKPAIKNILTKPNGIRVVYTYADEPKKIDVSDFSNYFRNRYHKLRDILASRRELDNIVSANKISGQVNQFSVIGMVQERRVTKNGNIFIILEDPTGDVKVIVSNRNRELFEKAEDLAHDEVIGIRGRRSNQFIFANDIIKTDLPIKTKKTGGEGYALFISDLHVGSNKFLRKQFKNFIRWLNLKTEGKNKEIAEKCKYLFIAGDLVDGVGIYPGQEDELTLKDLYEQYEEAAYLLSLIRDDIKIIAIPGNHDAARLAVPQPVFDENYAAPISKLKNVLTLSNPAIVNIESTEKFDGYDVLIYHGYSFNYFANNIKSLINEGYKNPKLLLSYLLQRRHLAPTHGSTPYIPLENDPLLITKVPDILVSGELHKLSASYYNNTALISCSCWQAKTPFQIKVGHEPDPCKVPALNLKSNTLKILDFS